MLLDALHCCARVTTARDDYLNVMKFTIYRWRDLSKRTYQRWLKNFNPPRARAYEFTSIHIWSIIHRHCSECSWESYTREKNLFDIILAFRLHSRHNSRPFCLFLSRTLQSAQTSTYTVPGLPYARRVASRFPSSGESFHLRNQITFISSWILKRIKLLLPA